MFAPKAGSYSSKSQIWSNTRAGLRWLIKHPRLRMIVSLGAVFAAMDSAWFAVLMLYVPQVLGLPAWGYGVLLGIGAVGGLAGGFFATRVTRMVGPAAALAGASVAPRLGRHGPSAGRRGRGSSHPLLRRRASHHGGASPHRTTDHSVGAPPQPDVTSPCFHGRESTEKVP
ncbi:MFS transporter [Nonomuraea sp. NBC_00507]|uniref:MFS transporter n=1 Tax=Nonomuraea sp. NBC_00507 TaxID=2976002 RepID=UPI003FA5CE85